MESWANGSLLCVMLRSRLAKKLTGTIKPRILETLMKKPPCLVWLPADHRLLGEEGDRTPYNVLADQYARAVKTCARAQPV